MPFKAGPTVFACLHRNLVFVKEKTLLQRVGFRHITASQRPDENARGAGEVVYDDRLPNGEESVSKDLSGMEGMVRRVTEPEGPRPVTPGAKEKLANNFFKENPGRGAEPHAARWVP